MRERDRVCLRLHLAPKLCLRKAHRLPSLTHSASVKTPPSLRLTSLARQPRSRHWFPVQVLQAWPDGHPDDVPRHLLPRLPELRLLGVLRRPLQHALPHQLQEFFALVRRVVFLLRNSAYDFQRLSLHGRPFPHGQGLRQGERHQIQLSDNSLAINTAAANTAAYIPILRP